MATAAGAALGAGAAALYALSRWADRESAAVRGAPTVRGGDLSAVIAAGASLPAGALHAYGRVTGPNGSGASDPDNTAVLFVKTRVAKVFECASAARCGVRWGEPVASSEALPVFELHGDVATAPPTGCGAGFEGQGLSSPVIRQLMTGGGVLAPYRGAGIRERVVVDARGLALEHVVGPDESLRVDTRSFFPAPGAPDAATVERYEARARETGGVDHIPPEHRQVVLGEEYTERSLNIGDHLHAVGTVRPAQGAVAVLTPTRIGKPDKEQTASLLASDTAAYLRVAALASAAAAVAAEAAVRL